jgi:threonine aldolase
MFCLSKGLCAPVGSLLAGRREFVEAARFKRKIMGGGMRQAGILAAAGIIALEDQAGRLREDHVRARYLEKELATIPGITLSPGDINMVYFSFPPAEDPKIAGKITEFFLKRNIRINGPERGIFRFVTHHWVGDAEIKTILEASREAFGEQFSKKAAS